MNNLEHIKRTFGPVYDRKSEILILGSFPSAKSREANFYYGHPQNRFWPVVAKIFDEEVSATTEDKRSFALRNHIALWDVIEECDISGSSDATIKNAVGVDILKVLDFADIREIFCNGSTSFGLYNKLLLPVTGRNAVKLPSTSPANAAWSKDRLFEEWKKIKEKTGST